MIHYLVLSSGSCGNCYAFYDGKTTVVIDQGMTYTAFEKRLKAHSIPLESVKAIFLTHLHPDHAKGAGATSRKLKVPLYLSDIAIKENCELLKKLRIYDDMVISFHHGDEIVLDDYILRTNRTVHDSAGSSCFTLLNNDKKIFLLTDTGRIPLEAHGEADNADVLFIESNYDLDMLRNGPYPKKLQDRIDGPYGHLSNDDAAYFIKQHAPLRSQVYLIHLSEKNNSPERARETVQKMLRSGIFLTVCERGLTYEGFIDE